jgi:hypothetical protein
MKKIFAAFAVIAVLMVVAVSYAATTAYVNVPAATPNDVSVTTLYTADTNNTRDTFATTDIHVHGPYGLTNAYSTPMFAGFAIVAQAASGTAPNFAIDYQLIAGTTLKDTLAGAWVAACTTNATAVNKYVSLTSQVAKAVVFRVNKYGSNAGYLNGYLRILWKANNTYNIRQ